VTSGGPPRNERVRGAESLTPSEMRIARVAADGRSNREIAETLFVTKSTVEWHLRNIFRKVGVSSRQELHTALGVGAERD
jgi:DNA-binding CsgD family transcriptional regulator